MTHTTNLNKLCRNWTYKSNCKFTSKICKLKPNVASRDKVINTSSKKIFDCVVPNGTIFIDRNSPNVIYLITYNR